MVEDRRKSIAFTRNRKCFDVAYCLARKTISLPSINMLTKVLHEIRKRGRSRALRILSLLFDSVVKSWCSRPFTTLCRYARSGKDDAVLPDNILVKAVWYFFHNI